MTSTWRGSWALAAGIAVVCLGATGCSDRGKGSDAADTADEGEAEGGPDTGECPVGIVGDASTCGNGQIDPGELCHELVTTLPPPPSAFEPRFLRLGDFNGDGHLDVSAFRSVYLGHGDGSFDDHVSWESTGFTYQGRDVAVGELDGAGAASLVASVLSPDPDDTERNIGALRLRWGGPDFPASRSTLEFSTLEYADKLGLADFDGDGRGDLVVSLGHGDLPPIAGLWLNRPEGFVADPALAGLTETERFCGVADVDGDGHVDVIDRDFLLGDGRGGFVKHPRPSGQAACYQHDGRSLAVFGRDLDCDGHNDMVGTNGDVARVWMGQGGGDFADPVEVAHAVDQVAVGDLNGDGALDIVLIGSSEVRVALGGIDGGFAPPVALVTLASGVEWTEVAVADLDGDGIDDIVGLHEGGADVLLAEP